MTDAERRALEAHYKQLDTIHTEYAIALVEADRIMREELRQELERHERACDGNVGRWLNNTK